MQILLLAREMGVHANASRHSALSYEHAGKIEAQLKAEVAGLMAKAEAADTADIPDELALREKRLQKLAEARAKMEARAKERFAREQTPEPVFGIIKSVLGFRQFSMRGLDKARGEWSLVTSAWNIKRMFTLKYAR